MRNIFVQPCDTKIDKRSVQKNLVPAKILVFHRPLYYSCFDLLCFGGIQFMMLHFHLPVVKYLRQTNTARLLLFSFLCVCVWVGGE